MHTCHLCCVICDCTCENVACGSVSVYTPRRLPEFAFQQAKKASLNKKFTADQSRMRIAKNSNFCSTSNRRAVPTELTRTKTLDAASFPVTSKDRSSILFEDRLDNHILQVLRTVGFFVVMIVVQDELGDSLCRPDCNNTADVPSFTLRTALSAISFVSDLCGVDVQ